MVNSDTVMVVCSTQGQVTTIFGSLTNFNNFSPASQHLPPQSQHVTKKLKTLEKRPEIGCFLLSRKSVATIKIDCLMFQLLFKTIHSLGMGYYFMALKRTQYFTWQQLQYVVENLVYRPRYCKEGSNKKLEKYILLNTQWHLSDGRGA